MSSLKIKRTGIIFIVSGPSGSGKTTLCKKLLLKRSAKGKIVKTISLTTRPRRRGEKANKDYRFVSEGEFLRQKARGQLLEHEKVFGFFYGTPKSFVEDNIRQGKDVILSIDVKGAAVVKKIYPEACGIFIMPPSVDILKQRLLKRSTESRIDMLKRLRLARWEMGCAKRYDYVIVNDKLAHAISELESIIVQERLRRM
ncbi:MAG: guanylate kinase [Candidatus Omnitrophica bacterium]|nr:guanylate kinase [Candidatus Omnitrophota bacterium]HOX55243.1 guanylate kinase [Candidatus Omnitrophota bacterium]